LGSAQSRLLGAILALLWCPSHYVVIAQTGLSGEPRDLLAGIRAVEEARFELAIEILASLDASTLGPAEKTQRFLYLAAATLVLGERGTARSYLERLLDERPEHRLGSTHDPELVTLFEEVRIDGSTAAVRRAEVEMRAGRWRSAQEWLERARALDPLNSGLEPRLAIVFEQVEKLDRLDQEERAALLAREESPSGPVPTPPLSASTLAPKPLVSVVAPATYQPTSASASASLYIDEREVVIESLPSRLARAILIRTALADTFQTPPITLEIGKPARVFVAHDARHSTRPGWLSTWDATGEMLLVRGRGPLDRRLRLDLYARDVEPGLLDLGPNAAEAALDRDKLQAFKGLRRGMYVVLVVEREL
jgi:tetratricopeptide (TPR) repeat protein